MREIKVGLLGLGTVGSGVLKMIQENGDKITNVTGQRITVKTALVRNPAKHEAVADSVTLTTDFAEILNDEEIDIAVELLGGLHPAQARRYRQQGFNRRRWSPLGPVGSR